MRQPYGGPGSSSRSFGEEYSSMSHIAPPPGLEMPWRHFPSPADLHVHTPILTTPPPHLGVPIQMPTPPLQEPHYLGMPSWAKSPPKRCESPLQALGLSVADDARSPEARPLCPQPRRAFVAPIFDQFSLPSSPSPATGCATASSSRRASPGLELHELLNFSPEKKDWALQHDIASRPLSSVSTSAGPTPSPEEFLRHPFPQALGPGLGWPTPGFCFEDSFWSNVPWTPSWPLSSAAASTTSEAISALAQPLKTPNQFTAQAQATRLDIGGSKKRNARPMSGAAIGAGSVEAATLSADGRGQDAPLTQETVVQMSKTQGGSKLLQRKLLKGHPSVIKDILEGMETELPEIMCNMYGNYLCSAAFQSCSVSQRLRMLEITSRNLCTIAKDKWGTHALQSLLSLVCTADEQNLLLPAFEENIVELSCDQHGSHVVTRALMSFGTPCPASLLERLMRSISVVSQNQHGLCVIKKCISQTQRGSLNEQLLLDTLSDHAFELVQNQYGNYVVQHSLEEWGGEVCQPVLQALKGRLLQLSVQKFSSNVVEHFLRIATPEVQLSIMEELSHKDHTHVLMSTVYGQHVARQLLKVVSSEQRAALEAVYNMCLRGPRNQRLREKWEGLMAGEAATTTSFATAGDDDLESSTSLKASSAAEVLSATSTPARGPRGRGGTNVRSTGGHVSAACDRPSIATELNNRGVLVPGLLSLP